MAQAIESVKSISALNILVTGLNAKNFLYNFCVVIY